MERRHLSVVPQLNKYRCRARWSAPWSSWFVCAKTFVSPGLALGGSGGEGTCRGFRGRNGRGQSPLRILAEINGLAREGETDLLRVETAL